MLGLSVWWLLWTWCLSDPKSAEEWSENSNIWNIMLDPSNLVHFWCHVPLPSSWLSGHCLQSTPHIISINCSIEEVVRHNIDRRITIIPCRKWEITGELIHTVKPPPTYLPVQGVSPGHYRTNLLFSLQSSQILLLPWIFTHVYSGPCWDGWPV